MSSEDNLAAAVKHVAETMDMTVKPIEKNDDGPSNASVLVRTTDDVRERWRQAAEASGLTLSAWIRDTLNAEAKNVLDCEHPMNMVRFYPWSQMCLKCGKRIK